MAQDVGVARRFEVREDAGDDRHALLASTMLAGLPETIVTHSFGPGPLLRGRTYARDGMVDDVEVVEDSPHYLELEATVRGSGRSSYVTGVVVQRDAHGWGLWTDCTCPVGEQCKHGAAVVSLVRAPGRRVEPASTGPPAWQTRLEEVLADYEPSAEGAGLPLALQVDLGRGFGSQRYSSLAVAPTVTVRPLRQGARGTWIKTGASWSDAASYGARRDLEPRQAGVLAQLAEARAHLGYYGPSDAPVDVGDLGVAVWPLLREGVEAGLSLVARGDLGDVRLATGPARVGIDVAAGSADGGYRLVATVSLAGEEGTWSGAEVIVLGRRAHGVGLLRREGSRIHLVLARLEQRLAPAVQRLLGDPEPLQLPPEAATALGEDYLPRLGRHLLLTSADSSVPLPEEQPPVLRLLVGWGALGTATLTWQWVHRVGRREEVVAFPAGAGSGPVPAPDLVEELDLPAAATTLLLDDERRAQAHDGLRGHDLIAFVRDVLPALREHPGVEVVDEAAPVDYRAARGEPVIRFEAGPADADGPETASPETDAPTDWLDLRVVVTVDGEQVPLRDVLVALTRGDASVVLASGLLLPTDHPALVRLSQAVRAAAELVDGRDVGAGAGGDPALRVGSHDLGLWAELSELGVVDEQASAWVERARALAGFTTLPQIEPPGIRSELRAYQLEGFRWLAFLRSCGLGGILADDMGLGKTLQALAVISHLRAEGAGPVLVVAPTSVVGNWVHEARRHAPGLVVRAISASERRRGTRIADELAGVDVLVTSYTLLRLEVEQYAGTAWGALVLDEAQQVKNHRGKTYQAVRCLDAGFRLALTGTPFENRLSELWSLLSIVAPGLYPDAATFTEVVASPVEKRGDAAALARFRQRVRPFLLRRTKDLVAADLPPKQEQVLEVSLTPGHRKVYDARLQRERQAILGLLDDFSENRVAIFAALTRLRQLSLDAGLVDPEHAGLGSAKLDALVERLREVSAEGHRALVFSQFTRFLRLARERLEAEGLTCVYLDGSTTDRPEVVRRFREGDDPVFLISLKAGGIGLTLTEADYVFVLDPWWNPAVEKQAVDRAHRIGQTRPVLVYRLVATDTIEDKVMELKARKAALFDSVLDGDATMAAAMTADDVRAMLGAPPA